MACGDPRSAREDAACVVSVIALVVVALPASSKAQTEEAPVTSDVAAPPPQPERFGDRGWFVVMGSVDLAYSSTSYNQSTTYVGSSTLSTKRLTLTPSIDYFVQRHFSIGLALGYDEQSRHSSGSGYATDADLTTLTGGVRAGYLVPLGRKLSLWPVVTAGVESIKLTASSTQPANGTNSSFYPVVDPSNTATLLFARLNVNALFHPVRHFFLGLSPYVARNGALAKADSRFESSVFGADLVIGGDFGGPSPGEPELTGFEPPPEQKAEGPRFGHRNSFVLSNDLVLGASATVPATKSTFAAQPSVDWFFVEHVSLGAATSFTYVYDSDSTLHTIGYGGGLRVGGDIPLSTSISLFPRGGFTASQLTGTIPTDTTVLSVGAFVPVLVHPAPHFFLGFGPAVSTELIHHTNSDPGSPTKATTLGVGMTVGGWL